MSPAMSIRENDKRQHPRVECFIRGSIGGNLPCEIVDLSTGGAFLSLPRAHRPKEVIDLSLALVETQPAGHTTTHTQLQLKGKVRRVIQLDSGRTNLALQFVEVPEESQKLLNQYVLKNAINNIIDAVEGQMLELDPRELRLTPNSTAVRSVLERIKASRAEISVFVRGLGEILSARLERIESNLIHMNLDQAPPNSLLYQRIHASSTLEHHSYYFFGTVRAWRGLSLAIELPTNIFSYDLRSAPRLKAKSSELKMEVPLPYPPDAILQRPIVDISNEGLAFRSPVGEPYFLPGTPLPEIRIIGSGSRHPVRSGQVRHVTPIEGEGAVRELAVGVRFDLGTRANRVSPPPSSQPTREGSFFSKMATLLRHMTSAKLTSVKSTGNILPGLGIELVRYTNRHHEELVGVINATTSGTDRLHAPLIIIMPDMGRQKESTAGLALTLVEAFKQHRRELVVLRYDGIRQPGESASKGLDRRSGSELKAWTLSQSMEDLAATLEFAYNNPRFCPLEVIVVSPGVQAIPTRSFLARNSGYAVHYWIPLMGATAAQSWLRMASGDIDYVAQKSETSLPASAEILGTRIRLDAFVEDAITHGLAYLEDARSQMTAIPLPVSWILGTHDAWVPPGEVRELMEAPSVGARNLTELPLTHLPLNGEEGQRLFAKVLELVWKFLFEADIEVATPSQQKLDRRSRLEWSRNLRTQAPNGRSFWRQHLFGSSPPTGQTSTALEFMQEYQEFIQQQIDLLKIDEGQTLADFGCGSGFLPYRLLSGSRQRKAWMLKRIDLIDFLPEATDFAHRRLNALSSSSHRVLPKTVCHELDLRLSPIRALRRFLRGEFYGYDALRGAIPGLDEQSIEAWKQLADWRLHEILRGRPINADDQRYMKDNLSRQEQKILIDFNRLSRFAQGFAGEDDLSERLAKGGPRKRPTRLSELKFDGLKPTYEMEPLEELPFAPDTFDRVACSLVLGALNRPDETLVEVVRCLKAGGRIVLSSLKPDADLGVIFRRALGEAESIEERLPEGYEKAKLIADLRALMNSSAKLLQMADKKQITLYSGRDLQQLAERCGLSKVEVYPSLGDPPQAYIAVGQK